MDNLISYQKIVQELLTEIHNFDHSDINNELESQLICDTKNNHYLLVDVGWNGDEYVYATFIHIDIKGGKIWIQRNNTELNLAESLVERGVKKEDIILGLHSAFMRQFSDYGVV